MIANNHYDDDELLKLLRRRMGDGDDLALAHVESCTTCQTKLETISRSGMTWNEVSDLLRPDETSFVADFARSPGSNDAEGILANPTTFLEPSDHPDSLGRFARYEIMQLLGRGGMGIVMRGFDTSLNRHSAIKVLAPELASSAAARKRFSREAKSAAAVVHPHVVSIQTVDEHNGLPYLVMPVVEGQSLQQRVEQNGPLTVIETVRIAAQVASGLQAAHEQGLVHRDIKPANVLLENGVERVQITDFGLARAIDDASMTRSGVITGTPQYMSPEQAHGDTIDHRSDLFSLGSLIYFMLAGRSPFRAETTMGVLNRIGNDEPRSLRSINTDVPHWLEQIAMKLLSKSPNDRFQTAAEVGELLQEWHAHLQQPTVVHLPAALVGHTAKHRSIFNVTRKGVMTMLSTLGLTLLGMIAWQATDAPDISGIWTSEEWGTVVLEAKRPGQYEGTFTGSDKDKPGYDLTDVPVYSGGGFGSQTVLTETKLGTVELKWSRVERRFNGTWRKGINRSGKMSLRVVNNEIRGAWTTGKDAQNESDSPRLADLLWKRMAKTTNETGGPADKRTGLQSPLDRKNARSVVEAWVAAVIAKNVTRASSLAKDHTARADQIEGWGNHWNLSEFSIGTVETDEQSSPPRALVVSSAKVRVVRPVMDQPAASFLVFALKLLDDVWFVTDVEPCSTVEEAIDHFLNQDADVLLPIQKPTAENKNPVRQFDGTVFPSEPVRPLPEALNEPLQVARVWLSDALAGNAEATQEIVGKKPAEAMEIAEFAKRTSTREIALHEVWIDDHDSAQIAIVVSAPITLQEAAERSDTAQLVLTLRKRAIASNNPSDWFVEDIYFKSGGLEDDRVQFQKDHLRFEMIWGGRKLELTDESPTAEKAGSETTTRLWNQYGVTPSPVTDTTARIMEWVGLHLAPIDNSQFRGENLAAKYLGGLDVTFVRTHGPAEKAGFNEVDIVVTLQGTGMSELQYLDKAIQEMRRNAKNGQPATLCFEVLRSGKIADVRVTVPESLWNDSSLAIPPLSE